MDGTQHLDAAADLAAAQVLAELDDLHAECGGDRAGTAVLQALRLCLVHGVATPEWVRRDFIRRVDLVTGARVAGWSEAFGRYWPRGTRLAAERRRLEMMPKVHAEAWRLVSQNPAGRPINRLLFDEVGEARGISMSGSAAEDLYYCALAGGALNLATWRRSALAGVSDSPADPEI